MSLRDKVVLITGAGKGIGRSAAIAFSAAGARVSALLHSKDDVPSLRAALSSGSLISVGDVSDEESVKRFISETISNVAGVDVVVNNASVLTDKSHISDVKTADWDLSMAVNLRGPFLVMKHLLPHFLGRRSGLIINVSSGAGRRPAPGWGPYAVSKGALEVLTAQTAAELNGTGVSVVSVDPGGTRTRMRAAAYPDEDPMTLPSPDEVAQFLVDIARRTEGPDLNGAKLGFREWKKDRE